MVIKDTPYVGISHDVATDILFINWKQKPTIKQLKDTYLSALQHVQQTCLITSFCTDLTAIGPLNREQEAWLMLEFYPSVYQIIKSSINAAVVFSEEHFKAIVTNYQQPAYLSRQDFIHFNYFTAYQEATHWLIDIKKGQETMCS
ncbi:hypothetical protein ABID22_003598 [Pontibacter aydingkolensis]|uniref:SpoIIAA-like n=1 Tax=Pontibacter aydingkolensis TaxID=1911536 RepID=A0ABS7CYL4_9BACT|nr:hypothetical protein [Pontibacter aydingkolensis]MBW7468944.1 hypothetical protein [Pontibacter aydingkolensis]